jgi:hypothetical protein
MVLKKVIIFLTSIFLFHNAYNSDISRHTQISLLTAEPGDELYAVFGHSGLRVKDTMNKLDIVFNYGTFDFNTPNFYLKFARGKLNYMLAMETFKEFLPLYVWENRTIYEQELNLTYEQKKQVYDFLIWNLKPENKFYKYDFFYDNCATRIRDIFDDQLEEPVQWDYTEMKGQKRSFRDLIDAFLKEKKWSKLGIDLALGLPTDKTATPYQYMFLPEWMMKGFSGAKVGNKPLVGNSKIIFKAVEEHNESSFSFTPAMFFWIIFGLGILLMFYLPRISRIYNATLLFVAGVIGIVEVLLWFATDHTATHDNFNLLWAIPLHFPIAFMYIRKWQHTFINIYFVVTLVLSFVTLAGWTIIPQDLNEAFIPLVLFLLIISAKEAGIGDRIKRRMG